MPGGLQREACEFLLQWKEVRHQQRMADSKKKKTELWNGAVATSKQHRSAMEELNEWRRKKRGGGTTNQGREVSTPLF
ncbi:uncharacterized [Tachysurus ichikawai]